MRGLLVREAHLLISPLHHCAMVLGRRCWRGLLLSLCRQRHDRGHNQDFHCSHGGIFHRLPSFLSLGVNRTARSTRFNPFGSASSNRAGAPSLVRASLESQSLRMPSSCFRITCNSLICSLICCSFTSPIALALRHGTSPRSRILRMVASSANEKPALKARRIRRTRWNACGG